MRAELAEAAARVAAASSYRALFGSDGATLKQTYRELARILHPDLYLEAVDKAFAQRAFQRLQQLYDEATRAASHGAFGDAPLAIMQTARGSYEFLRLQETGDLCDIYAVAATLKGGEEYSALGKVAHMAADNDLLRAEALAIGRLRSSSGDPKRFAFIPELLDTFMYSEVGKPRRATNIIARLGGFYSLEQVQAAYPGGITSLDMAWMWRRALAALGYAHGLGIIHGAVVPRHIMIHPEQHGFVLVGWLYASITDNGAHPPIKAIVEQYRAWYPEEVLAKRPPNPATDIAMAARAMVAVLGGDPLTGSLPEATIPKPIRAYLQGCLAPKQTMRPDDALGLLEEFDELLERLGTPYYPRRFHSFTMP
jgi:hypothetical protein